MNHSQFGLLSVERVFIKLQLHVANR